MVENRDPGSPEILPIYQDGKNVRFAGQPSDMANPTTPWNAPRAIYLMNASDPVVWFSPSLLFKEPGWTPAQTNKLRAIIANTASGV